MKLIGFRNYEQAEFSPAERITVMHGANAQGKTNLIEAVHLCCLGRSHRTPRDIELIRWGEEAAQVVVEVERRDGIHEVCVRLSRSDKRKKTIRINQSPIQRIGELMGHVNAVLFSPEDLRLIKDGPEVRRGFLDMEISQLHPAYFYALQRYVRSLAQRNELLRKLIATPSEPLQGTLDAWDAMLVENGIQVIQRRMAYLGELAEAAGEMHGQLSGGAEKLRLSYQGKAQTAEELANMLRAARHEDMRRGTTSVGPHRDDFSLKINGHDARPFASQGQQRTIVLSLKLAEIAVMKKFTGESPILLLDDVMSELDVGRRKMLLKHMGDVQTLITCTHVSDLGGATFDMAYRVESGRLMKDEGFSLPLGEGEP